MKYFCIALCIFTMQTLYCQDNCYSSFYNNGLDSLKQNAYRGAIQNFFTCKRCLDKPSEDNIDSLIELTLDRWVDSLDAARRIAVTQADSLKKARDSLFELNESLILKQQDTENWTLKSTVQKLLIQAQNPGFSSNQRGLLAIWASGFNELLPDSLKILKQEIYDVLSENLEVDRLKVDNFNDASDILAIGDSLFFAASDNGAILKWKISEAGDMIPIRRYVQQKGIPYPIQVLAIDSTMRHLVAGNTKGHLQVWPIWKYEELQSSNSGVENFFFLRIPQHFHKGTRPDFGVKTHDGSITSIYWTTDQQIIFSAGTDGKIVMTRVALKEDKYQILEQRPIKLLGVQLIEKMSVSKDEKYIAVLEGANQKVVLYKLDLRNPPYFKRLKYAGDTLRDVKTLCFTNHEGRTGLAFGDKNGQVHFWNASNDTILSIGEGHRSNGSLITCIQFNKSDSKLAIGHKDGKIKVWDFGKGVWEHSELKKATFIEKDLIHKLWDLEYLSDEKILTSNGGKKFFHQILYSNLDILITEVEDLISREMAEGELKSVWNKQVEEPDSRKFLSSLIKEKRMDSTRMPFFEIIAE